MQADVREEHAGTTDLDVGLALAIFDDKRYQALTERLRSAGFGPDTNEAGKPTRVVSMPCVELFMQQKPGYRRTVLPKAMKKRLAIEAGVSHYWRPIVRDRGDVLGVDTYGESAPAPAVFKHFGFTVENVIARVEKLIGVD